MKRFLIIRFSSLGDILLTIPVYKNIKLAYPDSKIIVLTKKQYSEIFQNIKEVDETIRFDNFFNTYKNLKNQKFDFLIDLHSNLRSFIFRKIIKADKKIRYKKDGLYRRIFVNFKIISPALQKHTVERYLSVLKELNIPIKTDSISLSDFNFNNKEKNKESIKNILVIQTAFLGDSLLTLPLLKQIKTQFPNSKLTVLCRADLSQIFENVKEIDEIIKDQKKTSSFFKEFLRLKREISNRNFDIAIIPHRSIRSALLAWMSKIKIRIGFKKGIASIFYTHKVPFSWLIHDLERNLSLLSPLTKIENYNFPELKTEEKNEFKNMKIKIGINPSSVWETKRWPKEKFISLINKLYEHYQEKVIILGGKNEVEYNKEIEEKTQGRCINLTGKTNLNDLIAIIKDLNLLITNDSGPMHIAVACNVPVIAIFGPTTKELGFFPYSKNSVVIEENLKCRPCKLHGSHKCPHKHFLCMNLISVEKVFETVLRIKDKG